MHSRTIEIDVDVHRAIERGRRGLGESENDILRRLLLPARMPGPRPEPVRATGAASAQPRRRGLWSIEIGGRQIAAANLKDAYWLLLATLHRAHPGFLEAFAEERTFGRKFVARAPAELYDRSPHLARHAQPLGDGWYFDSNLSAAQVAKRARIAARLCGLFYGPDVRILENLRVI
jgi:hypothetical protein